MAPASKFTKRAKVNLDHLHLSLGHLMGMADFTDLQRVTVLA